jgi:hypothetical protein
MAKDKEQEKERKCKCFSSFFWVVLANILLAKATHMGSRMPCPQQESTESLMGRDWVQGK